MSRKTRIRRKRSALIRTGLAKRLLTFERQIDPIEKSFAEIAHRVDLRTSDVPTGSNSYEPEEAEVVIVQLATPRRKRRWATGDDRQQTLASRLQKRPAPVVELPVRTHTTEIPSFISHAEEASVVIIVTERGRAPPPPLPRRNRDI